MKALLVEAKRSPIGKSHPETGLYRDLRADELLAQLLSSVSSTLESSAKIDDVLMGCVGQHLEQGKNIARLALLLAGLPGSVPGVTINRLCGSSLQAINYAALQLRYGEANLLVAGGVEHMHHVPMQAAIDYHSELLARYEFPFNNMGLTAEKLAKEFGISRQEQDEFALESHRKAVQAQSEGWFKAEIQPIALGSDRVYLDQAPRKNCDLDRLSQLPTLFKADGTVTAGNSSPINDGASVVMMASEKACYDLGLAAKAEIVGSCVVGIDPLQMGLGPVEAIQKLLKNHRLSLTDIDRFELNEAFASQAIACCCALRLPLDKVNPTGGAIALGHPLGATGARLVTTLVHGLQRDDQEWGIASLCVGHGQGIATLIRRCAQ